MDFFNKLGKKASETYKVTKEKTVKFSGEMKLKSKISEAKDKITVLYEEIGEYVYNNFKTNSDEGNDKIQEKCEEISNNFDEIAKLELDLLALKSAKKCVKCNEEISQKDAFCPKCGAEQPMQEEVNVEITKEADIKDVKEVEIENQEENEQKQDEDNQE